METRFNSVRARPPERRQSSANYRRSPRSCRIRPRLRSSNRPRSGRIYSVLSEINPAQFSSGKKGRTLMMTQVDRNEVKRLVSQGAQMVEVLPKAEYEEEHLPGAINIFLKHLDRKSAAQLDRERPIIVYCHDYQ